MIPAAPDGTVRIGGLALRDHTIDVPLDHTEPGGERIEVFAREVVAASKVDADLPWLLYLQGGPGGEADRPDGVTSWIGRAVEDFRVLLLDQRGTGRSTPVTPQRLAARGDAAAQAGYLALHRADAIVRDAELLRRALLREDARWSLLGQSFGGFCALTYLSLAPDALHAVHITGGLPSLHADAEAVYRAEYARARTKNAAFFAAYPRDRERLDALVGLARRGRLRLPDGSAVSARRLQMLGLSLGSRRRATQLHWLFDKVLVGEEPSPALVVGLQAALTFTDRPLYVLLQEACYAQGRATRWAAERVRGEHPDFADDVDPVLLSAEMIYPWLYDEDPALRGHAEVARTLAEREDWPALYDVDVLARNTVPVAAAVYADDLYVDAAMSLETARAVGAMRTWVTDAYEHDGLRESPYVLDRLIRMNRGEV